MKKIILITPLFISLFVLAQDQAVKEVNPVTESGVAVNVTLASTTDSVKFAKTIPMIVVYDPGEASYTAVVTVPTLFVTEFLKFVAIFFLS